MRTYPLIWTLLGWASSTTLAASLGTAFTYQGKLADGGQSANGSYDFRFMLYDVASGGSAVAAPITNSAVGVTNGLLTTELDFGAGAFTGDARWLEIAVRTNGGGGFATFPMRQRVTATPYALYTFQAGSAAAVASNSVMAEGLSTPVAPAAGQVLTFNGATLAWTNPAGAEKAWLVGGNAGIASDMNFVGTTDDRPLELRVNGARALRIEPGTSPRIVGGHGSNAIALGEGSTIAGGGSAEQPNRISREYSFLGGGQGNTIDSAGRLSVIGGGYSNRVASSESVIGGGRGNDIYSDGHGAVIGGGRDNTMQAETANSTIGGGLRNLISYTADYATISGGAENVVDAGSSGSAIGGGIQNGMARYALWATIAGGQTNSIGYHGHFASIGGGLANAIGESCTNATIGGGGHNSIAASGGGATVSGGTDNRVAAPFGTIGGGRENLIAGGTSWNSIIAGGQSNAIYFYDSAIGGGSDNQISGSAGVVIAGGRHNRVSGEAYGTSIGGGSYNQIGYSSDNATIGGGWGNAVLASALGSWIGGGRSNQVATGAAFAAIPGGQLNLAGGDYSFAAGRRAKALHEGAFVWADSTETDFASTDTNQFLLRAGGGVGIGTTRPQAQLHVAGDALIGGTNFSAAGHTARLILGDENHTLSSAYGGGLRFGVWPYPEALVVQDSSANVGIGTNAPVERLQVVGNILASGTITPNSDRHAKTDLREVDASSVLERVAVLPIRQWRFKTEAAGVKHVGPMGQDFRAAFGLGNTETAIATVDADGVALAAIQGLNQKLETALQAKEARLAELERRLAALEQLLEASTK